MTGIIDVGGGMRGIFGAGVCDCLLDRQIDFPYCLGVSAGSANLISYIASQRGRNYRFYTEYANRKAYMSFGNYVRKRSYFDLDYVYSTLSDSDGEDPVDFDAFVQSDKQFVTVATRASDGTAQYFTNTDYRRDNYAPLKASSAIPGVCRPCRIDGEDYFDGGVADPIPVQKALRDGCDKIVLILTRPITFVKKPEHFRFAYTAALRSYPAIVQQLNARAEAYNNGVAEALRLQEGGRAIIIAPQGEKNLTTFTKNRAALLQLYEEGYAQTEQVLHSF